MSVTGIVEFNWIGRLLQTDSVESELKDAQSQIVQSEKLAGLGQMVAGVAHEINNPLSFVSNNVAVLQRDIRGLSELLALYLQSDAIIAENNPQLLAHIKELAERMDLTYTQQNMRELLERSREGLRRIQQIVKDLRDFARLDESDLHDVDLNAGIQSTVNIVHGKAKKKRPVKPCQYEGCNGWAWARGYCDPHYQKLKREGHIKATRIMALAQPDEVLVSRTVRDLTAGSGLSFDDRGEHVLKGIPDRWQVFRAAS